MKGLLIRFLNLALLNQSNPKANIYKNNIYTLIVPSSDELATNLGEASSQISVIYFK